MNSRDKCNHRSYTSERSPQIQRRGTAENIPLSDLRLGCRITGEDPLFGPERKSLHRFGYQPGCSKWRRFGKRNNSICAVQRFLWTLQRVVFHLLPRLLWWLAETIMMSAAQTAPSEKPLMSMMDLPSVQVCHQLSARTLSIRMFISQHAFLCWQPVTLQEC